MMNFIYVFLMIQKVFAVSEKTCDPNGRIRYFLNNSAVERKIGYCEDQNGKLQSLNWKPIKVNKPKNPNSQFGHPYFVLCSENGGKPLAIQYWLNNQWKPHSICIFKEKSFVDVYNLF